MLIHFDNFQLYGGVAGNVTSYWSSFGGSLVDDPDEEATGKVARLAPNSTQVLKKYLNSNEKSQGVGIGARIMLTGLPTASDSNGIAASFNKSPQILTWSGIGGFPDPGYDEIMRVYVLSTGHLWVSQANTGDMDNPSFFIGMTDKPVIFPGTWQHIEAYYYSTFNGTSTFELRIEGETVISADGFSSIQFSQNTSNDPSIVGAGFRSRADITGSGTGVLVKDVAVWNKEGTENNDFLGPLAIFNMLPDAVLADGEWSAVGAADIAAALNGVPFSQSDYALALAEEGTVPFEVSLQDVSMPTWSVLGVTGFCVAEKIDLGYASCKFTVVSGMSEEDTDELYPPDSLNPGVFYRDMSIDPATGSIWTLSGLNAARFKMTRLT